MHKLFITILMFTLLGCKNEKKNSSKKKYSYTPPKIKVPKIDIPKSSLLKDVNGSACNIYDGKGTYLGQVFYSTKNISSMQVEHNFQMLKNKEGNEPKDRILIKLNNGETFFYTHYIKKNDAFYYSKNLLKTRAIFDESKNEIIFKNSQGDVALIKHCNDYTLKSTPPISVTPHYSLLAKEMYPNNIEDQKFVEKFFDILEIHKKNDPLMGQMGPGSVGYNISKMPIAFMINDRKNLVDLVIFNWESELFNGLNKSDRFTKLYSSGSVYILKDIKKKLISSQGDDRSSLTNFSYINGADAMLYRNGISDFSNLPKETIEWFRNWKPHPEYMDRDHPLRKNLNKNVLTILSPLKKYTFGEDVTNNSELLKIALNNLDKNNGGYLNTILGMMIHEMYHIKEGEPFADESEGQEVEANRKLVLTELKDEYAKKLLIAYKNITFELGRYISNDNLDKDNLLGTLNAIIIEIKQKYPNIWDFIWEYEYIEGFAEYVSAQSMVESLVTSLEDQISLQKSDSANNFVYRTGAIGGLYLYYILRKMPFSNGEHKRKSIWEIILSFENIVNSNNSMEEILSEYAKDYSSKKSKDELSRIEKYLISTVEVID